MDTLIAGAWRLFWREELPYLLAAAALVALILARVPRMERRALMHTLVFLALALLAELCGALLEAGGVGRARNAAPFHQSFSACQWISPSTRREPSGRRSSAPMIPRLVSGSRRPVSVARRPPLPAVKSIQMPMRSSRMSKRKTYWPSTGRNGETWKIFAALSRSCRVIGRWSGWWQR